MSKFKLTIFILYILIIISAFNNHCSAQTDTLANEKHSRMFLTFAVGMGIPLGEFAQFQKISETASYSEYNIAGEAAAGITGNLGFSYLFGKHFGITSSLNWSTFASKKMDVKEMYDEWNFVWNGEGETFDNGRWSAGGLLIGGLYDCSSKNFRFGFKLMAGLQAASSPETNLKTETPVIDGFGGDSTIRNFRQPGMKSIALAYGGGAYFGYKHTDALTFILSADFISANHTFNGKDLEIETVDVYWGSSNDPKLSHAPLNFKKQITFVSVTLGVSYNF